MAVERSKMGIILFVRMSTWWILRLYLWNLLFTCHFNPLFATNDENIQISEITSVYLLTRVNNFKTATNWKIPIFRSCCHMNWGLWTTGGAFKCLLTLYFPKFAPFFSASWQGASIMPGTHQCIFQRCVVSRTMYLKCSFTRRKEASWWEGQTKTSTRFRRIKLWSKTSINREAKSKGGVIGYTLRTGALLRWLLTRHVTGAYAERFNDICSSPKPKKLHEELGGARIKQAQRHVQRIKDFLEDQWQNPFDLDDEASTSLINITTGQVASKAVEMSMRKIPDMGKEMLEKFTTERLVEKTSSFWDPIPKMPVVTFSAMKKCLSTDKDTKLLIDTEVLFRRLLAVSKNRDVDMRIVLEYELAAVPPSMFHDDGPARWGRQPRLIWPRCWRSNVTSSLSYHN